MMQPVTTIPPLILVSGAGMILVALVFVGYLIARRFGVGYLLFGGGAWVVSVALKFLWAIPINTPVYNALTAALPDGVGLVLFYIYVGALTGVFEVALIWLALRYTHLGKVPWEKALAFGIGFGAIEAVLLGLSSLASGLVGLLAPEQLPQSALEQLAFASQPLVVVAPVVERLAAILIHVFSNVLLFYGAVTRQSRWFWAAFVYKTAVDAVAAFAQFWGIDTAVRLWTIEAVFILLALIALWGIPRVALRYPLLQTDEMEESVRKLDKFS